MNIIRRYALVVLFILYAGILVILHGLGIFPRPGLYDFSRFIDSPVVTIEGQVIHIPSTYWGRTRFLLEGHAWPLEAFHGRVAVTLPYAVDDLAPGERVRVRGWLHKPRPAHENSSFDEEAYWASLNTFTLMQVWRDEGFERLGLSHYSFTQRLWRFRHHFLNYWLLHLPYEEATLVGAITLGARQALPFALKQACIRAGVYHILVVSGQKMTWWVMLGLILLNAIGIPRRWAWVIGIPSILIYAILVGGDPPVARASMMAIVGLLTFSMGRDIPRIYPLTLAGFAILLWDPGALFGASFQLSFGATACVLFFLSHNPDISSHPWKRWIKEAAWMSGAVYIGVGPLVVYYFHQLSWAGLVANWTLFPLSGFIMVGGLIIGSCGVLMGDHMPPLLIQGMHGLMQASLWMIDRLSHTDWAVWPMHPPSLRFLIVYYLIMVCALFRRNGI